MDQQAKRDPYQLVGTTLDRYQIQSLVGIGGMGAVYRAQHELTKGTVAVKVLRPDLVTEDRSVEDFFDEARKTVTLNHPLIIRVMSAEYVEGLAFLVMEWLEGRTLEAELKAQGTLPLARVIALLEQICAAVAYAHRKGIIHRDLKPGNIMLVTDEQGHESIRILDFGIAKALSSTIGTNTRCNGTAYYASPEQGMVNATIDRRSDIYSLGVMLYQMLTGKVPFDADSHEQLMNLHRAVQPMPLRQVCPSIPSAVEAVVLRALAKNPAERFETAIDLSRALQQAISIETGVLVLQACDAEDNSPIANATVYLNSRQAGLTDVQGEWRQGDLMPRSYLIEVESPRYLRWHASVQVESREEATVTAELKRQPKGDLVVTCNVAGAEIELDSAKIGVTDPTGRLYIESVEVGRHLLKASHPQYLPIELAVEIQVWQQSFSPLELSPRGSLIEETWQKLRSLFKPAASKSPGAPPEQHQVELSVGRATVEEAKKAPATRVCHSCGSQVSDTLRFCTQCGQQLVQEVIAGAAPQPASEAGSVVPTELIQSSQSQDTEREDRAQDQTAFRQRLPSEIEREKDRQSKTWIKPVTLAGAGLALIALIGLAAWYFHQRANQVQFKMVSEPPGCQVVIDDQPALVTNAQGVLIVQGIKKGEHRIRISKEGYEPVDRQIMLPLAAGQEAAFSLTPQGMIYFQGETFQMGQDDGPENERPAHPVEVTAFYLDHTYITCEQYQQFVDAHKDQSSLWPLQWVAGHYPEGAAQRPVTGVTWDNAQAYAQWIEKRLPKEAEWELAARRKAGELGITGELEEWTNDDYKEFPNNPVMGYRDNSQELAQNGFKNLKVVRGRTYASLFKVDLFSYRLYCPATLADWPQGTQAGDYSGVGFRCARDASPRKN